MSESYKNPDLVEVGQLIRKHRKNAKMTQAELTEKTGFADKSISHLEQGHSNMLLDTFFILAQALDVTPNDISPSWLTSKKKDHCFSNLEARINRLSKQDQQVVYETISALVQSIERKK